MERDKSDCSCRQEIISDRQCGLTGSKTHPWPYPNFDFLVQSTFCQKCHLWSFRWHYICLYCIFLENKPAVFGRSLCFTICLDLCLRNMLFLKSLVLYTIASWQNHCRHNKKPFDFVSPQCKYSRLMEKVVLPKACTRAPQRCFVVFVLPTQPHTEPERLLFSLEKPLWDSLKDTASAGHCWWHHSMKESQGDACPPPPVMQQLELIHSCIHPWEDSQVGTQADQQ